MSEFKPSKAMLHATINYAVETTGEFPPKTNGEMVEIAIGAVAKYLSDPANAEDAKVWAEATMRPVRMLDDDDLDGLHYAYGEDNDTVITMYRVREGGES